MPALGKSDGSFNDGKWHGETVMDGGRFSHCAIKGKVGGKVSVSLVLSAPDAELFLGFVDPPWSVVPGASYDATLQVDDRAPRPVRAENVDRMVAVRVGQDPGFFAAMREGNELYLTTPQGTVMMVLSTTLAIEWLENCFTWNSGHDLSGQLVNTNGQAGSNPFVGGSSAVAAPAPAPSSSASNPFAPIAAGNSAGASGSASGDVAQLRDLLIDFGYPSPEIGDVSDQGIGFAYAWASDRTDLVGFLAIDPPDSDIRQHLIQDIAELSEMCGGRGGQPLYDTVLTSASGDAIYSGRADCGGTQGAIFFAVTANDESVLMFMHIAGPREMPLAQQINTNIRNYLRRL